MSEFNSVTICPDGDVHSLQLQEWSEVVTDGLLRLGHDAVSSVNEFHDDRVNLIFGAHLLKDEQVDSIPEGSIIVNLEQLPAKNSPVSQRYIRALEKNIVWDYSKTNLKFLSSEYGINHSQYLPISYSPKLRSGAAASAGEQDIDVLFYGVLNARRRAILNELDAAGLNVQVLVGIYGAERDEYIARSKVILSVSFYASNILESTRVVHALANGKAVVAECYDQTEYDSRLIGGAVLCDYDDLVSKCVSLVEDDALRTHYEARAIEVCNSLSIAETLKQPLSKYEQDLKATHVFGSTHHVNLNCSGGVPELRRLLENGQSFQAENYALSILALNQSEPEAWNVIGACAAKREDLETAETAFSCVTALAPESAIAHENLARVLMANRKFDTAVGYAEKAVNLNPNARGAAELLFSLLVREKRYDSVLDRCEQALTTHPESPSIMLDVARAFRGVRNVDAACTLYLAAIAIDQGNLELQTELAVYFYEQGRIKDAIAFYANAIEADKLCAHSYHGLGTCYHYMGDLDTALECYEEGLRLAPGMVGTWRNLSHVYHVIGNPVGALAAISQVVENDPADGVARVQAAYYRKHLCDWSEPLDVDLSSEADVASLNGASPFQVLPMLDDPQVQLRLSSAYEASSSLERKNIDFQERGSSKIRVGFFGSDFHNHATLVLMSGIFREYDREHFEFFVYSYGAQKTGAYRMAVAEQVDNFVDLAGATDQELVEVAREDQLDIAIDLKGFTNTGRLQPFEMGVAPVQISFLGYPGTLGKECMDYMIADLVTIPEEYESCYSEKILRMPHSYQPNDNKRSIPNIGDTRADHGLPSDAFVFCCFNNSYKIGPEEFDIWMRLLSSVDDSVLWLLEPNSEVRANLCKEAAARGVACERLIFAPRVSVDKHLARHRHANLFLDTFSVNAHTTSSDALWAGLPVLTKCGKQFAARVSASLLTAVGLDELVTYTEEDYEAKALQLAKSPSELEAIRNQLCSLTKNELPLFDTVQYVRDFEALLRKSIQV